MRDSAQFLHVQRWLRSKDKAFGHDQAATAEIDSACEEEETMYYEPDGVALCLSLQMFEAQATTGRTAIARHSASCDILPRSSSADRIQTRGPREEHRNSHNSGARDPARALQQPIESLKSRSYPQ